MIRAAILVRETTLGLVLECEKGGDLMCVLAMTLCVYAQAQLADLPSELRQLLDNRSFGSARIEYLSESGERTRLRRTRVGGLDLLDEDFGNADGVVDDNVDNVGQLFSCSPRKTLFSHSTGEIWEYQEGAPWARVQPLADRSLLGQFDARALGMTAVLSTSLDLESCGFAARTKTPGTRYDRFQVVSREEGRIEVIGFLDGHRLEHRWVLDARKGMNPIRCERWEDGTRTNYCESHLKQYDGGRWFPERVDYYSHDQLETRVHTLGATLEGMLGDEPVGPSSLGLVNGISIMRPPSNDEAGITGSDGIIRVRGTPSKRWANGRELALEDYHRGVSDGSIDLSEFRKLQRSVTSADGGGRFPPKLSDRGWNDTATIARSPGLWEEYTRRFIIEHRLAPEPTQRAWEFLRTAQDHTLSYLERQNVRLEELVSSEERSSATVTDPSRNEQEAADRLSRVFERELKSKLEAVAERASRR